jgi:hypothetical protein
MGGKSIAAVWTRWADDYTLFFCFETVQEEPFTILELSRAETLSTSLPLFQQAARAYWITLKTN